jgi:hypothetical protein
MANIFCNRISKIKQGAIEKRKPSGWILEKETSSFADEGTWYVLEGGGKDSAN